MLSPKKIVFLFLLSLSSSLSFSQEAMVDTSLNFEVINLINTAAELRNGVEYNEAEILLSKALVRAEKSKSLSVLAKVRFEIGILNIYQGNYTEALSNLQLGLSIYERLGDENGIAVSHEGIGSIYYGQKEYSKARVSYEKCLLIKEKGDDKRSIANALNNMGCVSSKMGNSLEAIEFHRKSLAIWEELGSVSGKAITLEHLANCLIIDLKLDEALSMLLKSHKMLQHVSNERQSVLLAIEIGNLMWDMKRYKDAASWCNQAYDYALKRNYRQEQQKSCYCLYKSYQSLNKSELALTNYKKYVAMRDSIFGQEMTKEITELEMNYAFEKEQLADSLRYVAEGQLQKSRIQRQRIGLVSIGSMLFLATALAFVVLQGKQKSDLLLLNILPKATAIELKKKGKAEAKHYDSVSILFTDFKGFTSLSEQLSPEDLVKDLDKCFSAFDRICETHGIEKIKTIGDAYMAAGGLPITNNTHAVDAVNAALEMAEVVSREKAKKMAEGHPFFEIRIGIHTGPVVAGIVGVKKFQYDIWGDTVNTASRMESSGEVGKVNISEATYKLLKNDASFCFTSRGKIEAKGKGKMEMYFAEAKT